MKNRLRYLDISTQVIADILKLASKDALPKDAQIIRTRYNELTNCWRLVIHSKEFDIVPEGGAIEKHGEPIISSNVLK